jgi:5-methylcytosine-specific restriction endonuclease McrA
MKRLIGKNAQNQQTRRESKNSDMESDGTMAGIFRGKVKEAQTRKSSRRHRHSALYTSYMQSEAWRELRDMMIGIVGGFCERCDASEDDVTLEVHHLTYERLGHEDPSDLQVLCPPCHITADAERAEETKDDLAYRRLDGWATKVYGPSWEEYPGYGEAEEAFDEWLERRA